MVFLRNLLSFVACAVVARSRQSLYIDRTMKSMSQATKLQTSASALLAGLLLRVRAR